MVVSAAKLEANRRNAQKSTGPRTDAGKKKSSLNAVTHGLRAETLVLLDEDPQVLEDRRAAWRDCLSPMDDVEERLVDDAVVYTWQQDRARRAQAKRINANITNYGVQQGQANAKEVEDLGRRLFKDRCGPIEFYPTIKTRYDFARDPSTSFPGGGGDDDPDRPGVLVLCLQDTLLGCEWMLCEWGRLKAILDQGQPWLSSDKLKAVRLLGKQPFDAIDERDVAMVFLASFVLKPEKRGWYWEIATELAGPDIETFANSAAARELDSLKPEDAGKARDALLGIIARATDRLTKKADAHRERALAMASLVPDILAFDDSPDGERLRRFDLASGRGLARALGELRRHRSSSVVSGPLSVVTNEPTVAHENVTNEPTGGPLSVVRCQLPVAGFTAHLVDESESPNEPTVVRENVTNEPTVVHENVTNEPTGGPLSVVRCQLPVVSCNVEADAPNEPTVVRQNGTNEPTVGPLSVVSGPLSVAGGQAEGIGEAIAPNEPTGACENVTNEPTAARENVTNEPKLCAGGAGGQGAEPIAGNDDGDEGRFKGGFSVQEAESIRKGCEKVRLARMEALRKLNEQAHKEAEFAMAARRLLGRGPKNKKVKGHTSQA